MKLSVIAVGKLKAGSEKAMAEDYLERAESLGRKCGISRISVTEFAESREATVASRKSEEAKLIAGALPPRSFVIALDERGRNLSSEQFSTTLKTEIDRGMDIAIVIGGPDGLAEDTRSRSSLVLSFGALTWPHRLVRVMLFEQLFRAITIMVGHPYHRQ